MRTWGRVRKRAVPGVRGTAFPGGGAEPERGDGAGPAGLDQVAELGSGERGVAEVVVGGDEVVVGPGVRAGGDRPEGQRAEAGQGAGDRAGFEQLALPGGAVAGDAAVAVAVAGRRQGDEAVGGHLVQRDRALIARAWPSGRRQSSAWQVASAIEARVGSVAARPVMASMSAGLKSRPQ